jgi:hypothetical protein
MVNEDMPKVQMVAGEREAISNKGHVDLDQNFSAVSATDGIDGNRRMERNSCSDRTKKNTININED